MSKTVVLALSSFLELDALQKIPKVQIRYTDDINK